MKRWIMIVVGVVALSFTIGQGVSAAPVNVRIKVERQAREVLRAANRIALQFKDVRSADEVFRRSYDAADEMGDLARRMAEMIKVNRWQRLEEDLNKLDDQFEALKREIDRLQNIAVDPQGNNKVEIVLSRREQLRDDVDELDDLRDELRGGIQMLTDAAEQQAEQVARRPSPQDEPRDRGAVYNNYYWYRDPGYMYPYPDYPVYFPYYYPFFVPTFRHEHKHIEIHRGNFPPPRRPALIDGGSRGIAPGGDRNPRQ